MHDHPDHRNRTSNADRERWMDSVSSFAVHALVVIGVCAPLSALFYWIGHHFVDRSAALQRLGELLLRQKDRALDRWPLNRYVTWLHDGRTGAAAALLGSMILAKSAACLLMGPIAAVWLPPACLTIPPLGRSFAQAQQRSGARWQRWMATQTGLQLGSHLLAAAVGSAAWWTFIRRDGPPWEVMMQSPSIPIALLLLSAALAVYAGWYEAQGHARHGLL